MFYAPLRGTRRRRLRPVFFQPRCCQPSLLTGCATERVEVALALRWIAIRSGVAVRVRVRPKAGVAPDAETPALRRGRGGGSLRESYAGSFLRRTAPKPARPRPNSARLAGSGTESTRKVLTVTEAAGRLGRKTVPRDTAECQGSAPFVVVFLVVFAGFGADDGQEKQALGATVRGPTYGRLSTRKRRSAAAERDCSDRDSGPWRQPGNALPGSVVRPRRRVSEGSSPNNRRYSAAKRPRCQNPMPCATSETVPPRNVGYSSARRARWNRQRRTNSKGPAP